MTAKSQSKISLEDLTDPLDVKQIPQVPIASSSEPKLLFSEKQSSRVLGVNYTADGKFAVACLASEKSVVYDAITHKKVRNPLPECWDTTWFNSCPSTPNSKFIVSLTKNGCLSFISTTTNNNNNNMFETIYQMEIDLPGHSYSGGAETISVYPFPKKLMHVAIASQTKGCLIFSYESIVATTTTSSSSSSKISPYRILDAFGSTADSSASLFCAEYNPMNGKFLAVVSDAYSIGIFNVEEDYKLVTTIRTSVILEKSDNNKNEKKDSDNNDDEEEEKEKEGEESEMRTYQLAWFSHSYKFVVGSADGHIIKYEMTNDDDDNNGSNLFKRTGFVKSVPESGYDAAFTIALSPNDRIVAVGVGGGQVILFSATTLEKLCVLSDKASDWQRRIAFHPSSRMLVSGADDCGYRVYSIPGYGWEDRKYVLFAREEGKSRLSIDGFGIFNVAMNTALFL